MFNFRPNSHGFGFNVVAPEEKVPRFRMNAYGTVPGASPGDLSNAFPAINSDNSGVLPGGTMFNVQPERHLPGLHNFRPPEEFVPGFRMNADGSMRDASTTRARLYPDPGGNSFGAFDQLGTNAFTSVGDGTPPPWLTFARALSDWRGKVPALDSGAVQPAAMTGQLLLGQVATGYRSPPTGRDRDIRQASLTDRPSETQEEREMRIFKVPIPRPDIPIPPPYPPPFFVPILPIIPLPEPDPRPPEAPPPAPGNRIALPST